MILILSSYVGTENTVQIENLSEHNYSVKQGGIFCFISLILGLKWLSCKSYNSEFHALHIWELFAFCFPYIVC